MKRTFLLALLALVLPGAASAADMSVRHKAPPPPVPVFDWSGCYLGVHGGYGIINDSYTGRNGGGGVAGGQVGCNYQAGQIVVGIEAEGWWSGIRNVNRVGALGVVTSEFNTRNRWDADVALRLGLTPVGRVLGYSKVGVAWGEFDYESTTVIFFGPQVQTGNKTLIGMLVGAGLEYALLPNWTAKIEYNYINYLGDDVTLVTTAGAVAFESFATHSATKHVVKVGMNFKFW
jgi:outer membrane immunogenic protein